MTAVPEPVGTWWLDDGRDSGVWPVKVHDVTIFGARVEGTNPGGPYFGETIICDINRVYDSAFNRPDGRKWRDPSAGKEHA